MFYQIFNAYSLHDTKVNRIVSLSDGIVLFCDEGINVLTDNLEGGKTSSCKVKMCINDFDPKYIFQHVEIKKQHKNRVKEMDFESFVKLLQKYNFKIYLDYFCVFSHSIKLEGVVHNFYISLTISDIDRVEIIK